MSKILSLISLISLLCGCASSPIIYVSKYDDMIKLENLSYEQFIQFLATSTISKE